MAWYTIFVETGYEDEVSFLIKRRCDFNLANEDYRLLVPKRRLIERKNGKKNRIVRKMFPGYVLVETINIFIFYKLTFQIPHIINFLRVDRQFLEIKEEEINFIINLVNKEGIIELSNGIREGDGIHIIHGPLKGYEGIIQKIDWRKCRLRVNFYINNCIFPIYLGLEDEYTVL